VTEADRLAGPLWRQSLRLIRRHPRTTLLPLLVTQLPLSVVGAAAWAILLGRLFPEAPVDSATKIASDAPPGLVFSLVAMGWAYGLFTLVGLTATVVAVNALATGKRIRLADALDPAFTRMGSLLAIGAVLYGLVTIGAVLAVTVVGSVGAAYLLLRFGLAFHAMVLEGSSPNRSLRRSWALLRGQTARFLGYLLTVVPVGIACAAISTFAFALLSMPFVPSNPGRAATIAIDSCGFVVLGLAFVPTGAYLVTITTLFYINLRSREHA
jgi:hypothetical protein